MPMTNAEAVKSIDRKARLQVPHQPAPKQKPEDRVHNWLEVFIADYERDHGGRPLPHIAPPTGKGVAVVGSGPAGLAVAEMLAIRGHTVRVFEAWPEPGGVLRYGIPDFKMDKRHVDDQVEYLEQLGVEFQYNTRIRYDIKVAGLLADGYI